MDVKPWTMKQGIIVEYTIDGDIWIKKKTLPPPRKQNYFIRYLEDIKVGRKFKLEGFYKLHPSHQTDSHCKDRLQTVISELINDRSLLQLSDVEFKKLK